MWTECHLSLHPLFLKRWCSMIIFSSLVVVFFTGTTIELRYCWVLLGLAVAYLSDTTKPTARSGVPLGTWESSSLYRPEDQAARDENKPAGNGEVISLRDQRCPCWAGMCIPERERQVLKSSPLLKRSIYSYVHALGTSVMELWGRTRRSIVSLLSWSRFSLAAAVASPVQQGVLRDPWTRLQSGNEQQQRQHLERKTESTGSWLAVHTGFWLRLIELSPVSSRVRKHSWEQGLKASSYSQWECANFRLLRSTTALACFFSHLWTLKPSLCSSLVTTEGVRTSCPSHTWSRK